MQAAADAAVCLTRKWKPGEFICASAAVINRSSRRGTSLSERGSVFVVDDDPSIRTSVNRLLREHGFAATLFDSAGALLDHGSFDKAICIVLDINLNGRSGIDLRRQLARRASPRR